MFSKTKYSCCLCSDLTKNSSKQINFCKDCIKVREFIRIHGIGKILELIENNKVSAPAYNTI